MKNFLKKVKYCLYSILFVLRRRVLAPFYHIRLPLFTGQILFGKHVSIGAYTRVYVYDGNMVIGDNTAIYNNSKIILNNGRLIIGKNCSLGEYGIYNTFSNIVLGDNVLTADRVSFITNIHDYEDINIPIKLQGGGSKEIIVGDGTWIGVNATLLAGCNIGKNCIIGANSVVKGSYPDYCVIVGTPARVVKRYNSESQCWEKV